MSDTYRTLAAPGTGTYKDRGSKFVAYAFPVESEEEALGHLECLRKEHPKARHHCFAWRLGTEGRRFRFNDDGEPTGTAGRPILGQIDAAGLTNVVVIVVRYFDGTLLGTSGLIRAYRQSAAEALRQGQFIERMVLQHWRVELNYALLPEWIGAARRAGIDILREEYGTDRVTLLMGVAPSRQEEAWLQLKALLWKSHADDVRERAWPDGVLCLELLG
jgi:uncharacterized YigZ family protein